MSNDKEIIGRKQRKYKRKKSTMKIRRGRGVLCVDGENYRLIGKKMQIKFDYSNKYWVRKHVTDGEKKKMRNVLQSKAHHLPLLSDVENKTTDKRQKKIVSAKMYYCGLL